MHFPEDQPALAIGARREVLERDTELSALADAVQAAAGGPGCVVLIMGEAGIGKSGLVEALRARLPGSGRMLVLGLRFLHRRNHSFVGGVGPDARFVAAT